MNPEALQTLVDENEVEAPVATQVTEPIVGVEPVTNKSGVSTAAIVVTVILLVALIAVYIWMNRKQALAASVHAS